MALGDLGLLCGVGQGWEFFDHTSPYHSIKFQDQALNWLTEIKYFTSNESVFSTMVIETSKAIREALEAESQTTEAACEDWARVKGVMYNIG